MHYCSVAAVFLTETFKINACKVGKALSDYLHPLQELNIGVQMVVYHDLGWSTEDSEGGSTKLWSTKRLFPLGHGEWTSLRKMNCQYSWLVHHA